MRIDRIDHIVLTVADIERTCAFYVTVLGMEVKTFGDGPTALTFGSQKINLHRAGHEFEPKSLHPTPGSADFCLVISGSLRDAMDHLARCNVVIEVGPVQRTGALSPMESVYIRDPDGNLVELSAYG